MYEGEIKDKGDTVEIRTTPSITIRDYEKGQDLVVENPESPVVELFIDNGKYFNFTVDDVDAHQSDINLMDDWSNDASMQMKKAIDTQILGDIYADVNSDNKGTTAGVKSSAYDLGASGSPVAVTRDNVLDYFVYLGAVLSEQDVPENKRWIVIPEWMAAMIKLSDLRDKSMTGDSQSPLRNGRIGRINDMTIYRSNHLTSVTDGSDTCWYVMAGHMSALTFASQMTKFQTLTSEKTFAQLIRGLNVYGYKVIKDISMALLYAKWGA